MQEKQQYVYSQLAEPRWENIVTTSFLTFSQRPGMIENESCTDVSFRHCDNVTHQRCQDVATTLLQRCHNIKHSIPRPYYYGLFSFVYFHSSKCEKVTKVLSGIKYALFLFKRTSFCS